jgi:menaquinone-dependent protoporphyrinogen oxidase
MQNQKSSRRDFIKCSLTALLALNFGCTIKGLLGRDKNRAALIYGTKYGATRDTASWIKKGAGNTVDLINIENLNFKKAVADYDLFIIGSGVWIDGIHKRLKQFLSSESSSLQQKVVASFVVCGSRDTTEGGRKRIKRYLDQIHTPLAYKPALSNYFGGRVIVEQLTEEDREALTRFYKKYLKKELESWDRTEEKKAVMYGEKLGHLIEPYEVKASSAV